MFQQRLSSSSSSSSSSPAPSAGSSIDHQQRTRGLTTGRSTTFWISLATVVGGLLVLLLLVALVVSRGSSSSSTTSSSSLLRSDVLDVLDSVESFLVEHEAEDARIVEKRTPLVVTDVADKDIILAFVHQRKAGGTSVRFVLVQAFSQRKLHTHNSILVFPCFYFLPCNVFTADPLWFQIRDMSKPVRVVGHVSYNEVERIAKARGVDEDRTIACITQMRSPVDRVLSCLHYRTREEGKPRTVTDFTPRGFRRFLMSYRDKYGYGCNNEIARMFTDETDEDVLNDLSLTSSPSVFDLVDDYNVAAGNATKKQKEEYDRLKRMQAKKKSPEEVRKMIRKAKESMSRCVVFLLNENDSNNVLAGHFYPDAPSLSRIGKQNSGGFYNPARSTAPEYIRVIMELNEVDSVLFDFGLKLHRRQLGIAMNAAAGAAVSNNNGTTIVTIAA